jgi:alkylhydroperoxidase/carboxymuconolactone decarboxylase family protein YurZ
MIGDDRWYEAAFVVGITNALNVVADGLGGAPMPQVEPATAAAEVRAVFADIRAFYGTRTPVADVLGGEIPTPFGLIAHDPGYLADVWAAVKRAFTDRRLSRRHKEALAFAVSLTTRSAFGTAFHLGEMRRLGVSERGVMEVVGVTQMFSSYTKIADTLQLSSDMADIAPADASGVPDPGAG